MVFIGASILKKEESSKLKNELYKNKLTGGTEKRDIFYTA